MATNPNDSAQAFVTRTYVGDGNYEDENHYGLTKRELFAAMAMQGACVEGYNDEATAEMIAILSVAAADALIAELNKEAGK